jgi:predicted KAP-like P-loop ATPase
LIESNGKWFYFARELFNVSKKIAREDKQKYLEKYERFFEGNINDHI